MTLAFDIKPICNFVCCGRVRLIFGMQTPVGLLPKILELRVTASAAVKKSYRPPFGLDTVCNTFQS